MVPGQVMCIAVVISASTLGETSQDKTPAENLIIDYVSVPNTLEEAVERSHVIVRAQVIGSGYRKHAHPTDSSIADAYTAYSLRILETLKSDSKVPFPDEVLRFGGELVTDKGVQRSVEQGFPKFENDVRAHHFRSRRALNSPARSRAPVRSVPAASLRRTL
jgi:hypothetical protein